MGNCAFYLANGALPEVSLENIDPALLVRQRDVYELVQTAGSEDGRVDDVRAIGGSNDEDVLLAGHAVHLRQDLVDYAVGCSTTITRVATTRLGDGVQLVKEEHAGGGLASLEDRGFRRVRYWFIGAHNKTFCNGKGE